MDPSLHRKTEVDGTTEATPPGCVVYVAEGHADDQGKHLELRAGTAVIGADPGCDLVLHDPKVSRRHAELAITEGGVRLTDLGSTNGCFVLGNRIRQADLQLGGRLRVGQTDILLLPIGDGKGLAPEAATAYGPLRGSSALMRRLFATLKRLESSTAPVLIHGETGTGKELVARAIHEHSARRQGPFVVVDCGALPKDLIDSELFGHAKGSFTGAAAERVGLLEQAHRGTLFLDEIGDLPIEQQPRLLRALESRQIRRVGENAYRDVDVRVVAASHRDIAESVERGAFRQDLYYRLAVVKLRLPSLRERRDDVPLLAETMAQQLGHATRLPKDVLVAMTQHDWPGNVRELRNAVHRLLTLGDLDESIQTQVRAQPEVGAEDQPGRGPSPDTNLPYKEARERIVDHFEAVYVQALVDRHGGDIGRAAEEAGIVKKYFKKLMEKHGIPGGD